LIHSQSDQIFAFSFRLLPVMPDTVAEAVYSLIYLFFNGVHEFVSSSALIDSLVLRNPQLRQAAKR
jgi:hypothetical protein